MEDFLKKKLSRLNYQSLIELIRENKVVFVDTVLAGPLGLTTPTKVYLDLNKMRNLNEMIVYFVFLHEIYHFIQFQRFGKAHFVKAFMVDDFTIFHNSVIKEEIDADEYGKAMFFKFNGFEYPYEFTQMLDKPEKKSKYEMLTKHMFGQVKNETDFDNLLNKYIVK